MRIHILALLAVTSFAEQEPAAPIAFVGVQVVPMDEERVLADQTVVIREGRIVALGPGVALLGEIRLEHEDSFFSPGLPACAEDGPRDDFEASALVR